MRTAFRVNPSPSQTQYVRLIFEPRNSDRHSRGSSAQYTFLSATAVGLVVHGAQPFTVSVGISQPGAEAAMQRDGESPAVVGEELARLLRFGSGLTLGPGASLHLKPEPSVQWEVLAQWAKTSSRARAAYPGNRNEHQ